VKREKKKEGVVVEGKKRQVRKGGSSALEDVRNVAKGRRRTASKG